MNKEIIILFIIGFLLFTIGCNTQNNKKQIDKIEQLAKISAVIIVAPERGPEILKKNGYTLESYKKAITNIMLDNNKFNTFLKKRQEFLKKRDGVSNFSNINKDKL